MAKSLWDVRVAVAVVVVAVAVDRNERDDDKDADEKAEAVTTFLLIPTKLKAVVSNTINFVRNKRIDLWNIAMSPFQYITSSSWSIKAKQNSCRVSDDFISLR
jgi:hypothetical protein